MTDKKIKKKGMIRTEAVVPFFIIVILFGIFFTFLFDPIVKWTIETAGYHAIGAEVNVGNFETSFTKASVRIQGIEVTDSQIPARNSLSIGDIRFSALWDALLRGKFVVNEVAVEQIEFGKPRKSPGKVKPPEPVEAEPADGSAPPEGTTEAKPEEKSKIQEYKEKALSKTEEQFSNNILGDAAAMLGGTSAGEQGKKIEGTVKSKPLADKLNQDMKVRNEHWKTRLKTLPTGKDFQALSDRYSKIKFKDFKTAQELQTSLREFEAVLKEADRLYKELNSAQSDLKRDLDLSQQEIRDLEKQIRADVAGLESRFKIPKLDAKSLSRAVFKQYLDPYLEKFNHYKKQAEKYVPPNIVRKVKGEADPNVDPSMVPRAREKGIVYEFGRPNSYPGLWIKRVKVSSEAGRSPYAGDVRGEITNITTNQALIGQPTVAAFAGDFPGAGLRGLDTKLVVDARKAISKVLFDFALAAFPIEGRKLVDSGDVTISFKKAQGQMKLKSELLDLRDFKMGLDNNFTQVAYDIEASSKNADDLLEKIFAGIPVVSLNANGWGVLPGLNLSVNSNLGAELQRGIENQLKAKVAEARANLEKQVNDQVGSQKAQIEAQYAQIKGGVEKELSKLREQADSQKKAIESRQDQAKRDAEKQGRKKAEDELKKRLGL